jgi:hypothetical protein
MQSQQPFYQPGSQPPVTPQGTPAPPQLDNHGQYEFIINPNLPKKSPMFSLSGGSSTLQRVAIAGGALVVLIILIIIGSSLIFGGSSITKSMISVAQAQQELIRINVIATSQAVSPSNINFAYAAQLSLTTEQQQTLAYLKTQGTKVGVKQLSLTANSATTKELTAAEAASTFDGTFDQVMQTELTSYSTLLKDTFNSATGPNARKLLNADYSAAQLLLKQLPAGSASST